MTSHPDERTDATPEPFEDGVRSGSSEIFLLLYAELRALAQCQLAHERTGHTLNATALVHEAYMKLSDSHQLHTQTKAQFCAVAAQAMRRVLVDHARTRGRLKRGRGARRESLAGIIVPDQTRPIDVLALDDALTRLAVDEPVAARVVELRYFAGLRETVIAELLGINERTVRRHWTFAKAWLLRELGNDEQPGEAT